MGSCLFFTNVPNSSLVLIGGKANDNELFNDVFIFDLSINQYKHVKGDSMPISTSSIFPNNPLEGYEFDPQNDWGGGEVDCFSATVFQRFFISNDEYVWEYSVSLNQFRKIFQYSSNEISQFSRVGTFDENNIPHGRLYSSISSISDTSFLIFGGFFSNNEVSFGDLLEYSITLNQFKLLSYPRYDFKNENVTNGTYITNETAFYSNITNYYSNDNFLYSNVTSFYSNFSYYVNNSLTYSSDETVNNSDETIELYTNGSYHIRANPPHRFGAIVWGYQNMFYLYGGRTTEIFFSDFWVWNQTVQMWKYVRGAQGESLEFENIIFDENNYDWFNIPSRRTSACSFVLNGILVFFGGYSHLPVLVNNDIWMFDVNLNRGWKIIQNDAVSSYVEPFQIGQRTRMSCAVDVDNRFYVYGAEHGCSNVDCSILGELWRYFGFENRTECYGKTWSNGSVCNGNGYCVKENSCFCKEGYFGSNCNEWNCFGISKDSVLVCTGGNGSCASPNQCTCNDGYEGDECNNWSCYSIGKDDPDVCSSNGSCIAPNQCCCLSSYDGDECENWSCYSINKNDSAACSSSNGTCIAPDECFCENGYTGNECESWNCYSIDKNDPSVCSSPNESCVAPNICLCDNENECETWDCYSIDKNDPNVCSNPNGSCVAPDECVSDYIGNECETWNCYNVDKNDPSSCSNPNGSCVAPGLCLCVPDYNGNECDTWNCYAIDKNDADVCFGNGSCISSDNCLCDIEYLGDDCNQWRCNEELNHVSCSYPNGSCFSPGVCQCSDQYEGLDCEYWRCNGNLNDIACSFPNGSCISPNECDCNGGYFGVNCEKWKCAENFNDIACSFPNGSCVAPEECICENQYNGDECETWECYSVDKSDTAVCSNPKGSCVSPNQCLCAFGYNGEKCDTWDCYTIDKNDSAVCSNPNGSCIAPNQCLCSSGFNGNECDTWDCYSIDKNDSSVCSSSNGNCVAPNQCFCAIGYNGNECDTWACYTIDKNDSTVCSNPKGSCVAPNQCLCSPMYYGNSCEIWDCYGLGKNDLNVCSYPNGTCGDPNECVCENGYFGSECKYWNCFGKNSLSQSVCSKRGICLSPNQCFCDTGYTNERCQHSLCNGIPSNSPEVCSSNGLCVETECVCRKKYGGRICENRLLKNPIEEGVGDYSCRGAVIFVDKKTKQVKLKFDSKIKREFLGPWKKKVTGKQKFSFNLKFQSSKNITYDSANVTVSLIEKIPVGITLKRMLQTEQYAEESRVLGTFSEDSKEFQNLEYTSKYEHRINLTQEIVSNSTVPFELFNMKIETIITNNVDSWSNVMSEIILWILVGLGIALFVSVPCCLISGLLIFLIWFRKFNNKKNKVKPSPFLDIIN